MLSSEQQVMEGGSSQTIEVNKTPDVRIVEGQSKVVPDMMGKEGDIEIVVRRGSSAKSYRTGQENVTASLNG